MAIVNNQTLLEKSIWDQLLDRNPETSRELPENRYQTLRELKRAVAKDLEALLNTRQETQDELIAEFPETKKSLLAYGLPDFTSFNLNNPDDRVRIETALEQAITRFEKRLRAVAVTLAPLHEHEKSLHFRVEARLQLKPKPQTVTFDAVLELSTREYEVKTPDV